MYKIYAEGIIEVITGPMFSGKTEELIRRVKILGHANVKTLIIKPAFDTRWDENAVITRAGSSIRATTIIDPHEVLVIAQRDNYQAVAFDEVQFMNDEIINVVVALANMRKRVLISGLDQDSDGNPFGPMPRLLSIADIVDKQQAVCMVCTRAATMTYKKSLQSKGQRELGDSELYEARCRECHYQGQSDKKQKAQDTDFKLPSQTN